jgi:hypothetical protein
MCFSPGMKFNTASTISNVATTLHAIHAMRLRGQGMRHYH